MSRPSLRFSLLTGVALLIAFFLTVAVTITPVCGALFRCGCTFAEGLAHCNVWERSTPSCPWCSGGPARFYVPFSLILLTVGAGIVWTAVKRKGLAAGFLVALALYPIAATLIGLCSALYAGYPYFLFWDLAPPSP